MKKQDLKNQFRLIRDCCKLGETKTIICMVITSILEGVRPYISLLLMGRLLDMVHRGAYCLRLRGTFFSGGGCHA